MNFPQKTEESLQQLKTPPHSDEAEEAVIGSLLIDNNAWESVGDFLQESDFFRQSYRVIFKAIYNQALDNQPFDYITIIDQLKNTQNLDKAGGESYIATIVERTLSSANVKAYAEIVKDKSILRQLIGEGNEIVEMGYFPKGQKTQDLLDLAEQKVFAIAEKYQQNTKDGFVHVKQLTSKTLERIQELAKMDSKITGLPTGWKDLDEKTSGLHPGQLIIIAARPGMGKTAFLLNIATNIAIEKQENVALFSLEMPGEELVMRLLSALGQINQNSMRTGKLSPAEVNGLKQAVHYLSNSSLFIDDNPMLSPMELRSKCRRLVRENGPLGLIAVDYLQLMEVRGSNESRVNQVSEISRSLKMLAKEFNCPVIALSQLNRGLEQRTNKRPIMSDLRESGAIEQDADIIMFIYRGAVYASEEQVDKKRDRTAEIIIGKQRNGPIGEVKLAFMGEYTRFVDFAAMPEDQPF